MRLRSSARRAATGLHVLEGVPPFLHACESGVEFEAIYHSRILLRSDRAQKLVRHRKREGIPTRHMTPEAFRGISRASRASGILAVARQRWTKLESLPSDLRPCLLVLEHIRSPGNLGTILRTAEAAGVPAIVLLDTASDPYDLATIRASMGAVFDLLLVRTTHRELATWSRAHDVQVVGTSPRASLDYTGLAARSRRAILLGDERGGLTEAAFDLCDDRVSIPIRGRGDSLNVAVAAGVLIYGMLRSPEPVEGRPGLAADTAIVDMRHRAV